MAEGIRARHQRKCRSGDGGRCNCKPGWEAWVYLPSDERTAAGQKVAGQKIRKTFRSKSAASSWRTDAKRAVDRGELKTPIKITLTEAIDEWLTAARKGTVLARHGEPYRQRVLAEYEGHARGYLVPEFGARRLSAIRRNDVQALANRLTAEGKSPSTVRNILMPLRAVYRWYKAQGAIAVSPTADVELPKVTSRRERFASPAEAAQLIAAVPEADRPLWATAFYTGLRLSELRALRWSDVDLAQGILRVERTVDERGRVGKPKSKAGRRRVPIWIELRDDLVEHRMRQSPTNDDGLVFAREDGRHFAAQAVRRRARAAWRKAGLEQIDLHECRHTFASLMIAAGVNAKAIQTYMGHQQIQTTYDLYGHLMPGSEAEAARLLERYLKREARDSEPVARAGNGAAGAQAGAQEADKAL